jgi:lipid-binding SYLF domain-containing protein
LTHAVGPARSFPELDRIRAFQPRRCLPNSEPLHFFRFAMKKFLLLSLVALFGAALARAEPSRADLVTRIETCEAILQEFQPGTPHGIPPQVWARAKALLILNQFKAGIFLGVQDGYGVIMVKKPDGRWSIPVLINAGEASIGLQLGAKSVESVYIITDENTPRMLFSHRFNIGVDAKAVAGPKAAETERVNEEILKTPLLGYTKTVGLYAGATLKAGHISRNDPANFLLYSTRYTMPELLYSDWVKPVKEVEPLMALVQKLAR